MKVIVNIPDGKYCDGCIFIYGGGISGGFCRRYEEHQKSEVVHTPYTRRSLIRLPRCVDAIEPLTFGN